MTRRRFASGLRGNPESSGRLYRGVAGPNAPMLLLRSRFRYTNALAELVKGGLQVSCRNLFALDAVEGVEGGRLAEYGVPGLTVDAEAK